MESKRDFLKKISLLTAGGFMAGNLAPVIASAKTAPTVAGKKVIGLQIYSLLKELTENVPEGMKKIKEIGYSTIELAGYNNRKMGQYEVSEYRKIVEDAGLKITSAHVNPPERKYTSENTAKISDWWKQTVEDHVKLGVGRLIQPGMPTIENHEDVKLVCEVFNNCGRDCKSSRDEMGIPQPQYGVQTDSKTRRDASNRPGAILRPVGDIVYDLMVEGTDPSLVFFEMDVYWTVMGQMDPLDYFEKYPTRIQVLHIKDRSVLGQSGMMNFENIFKKAYSIGINEFYVEIEKIKANMTQFEGVKGCFDYLNNAPFVK